MTTWNLSTILPDASPTGIESALLSLETAHTAFAETWKARTDWKTEPTAALEALVAYEQLQSAYGMGGPVDYYLSMKQALDSADTETKAALTKLAARLSKTEKELFFFEETLSKLPQETLAAFLANPTLAPYHHFLERLAVHGKYLLSESEEYILSRKSVPARQHWTELVDQLLYAETVELGGETLTLPALMSKIQEPATSEEAAVLVSGIMQKHAPVAAAEMTALLLDHQINDELRKRDRPDTARHLSDDIASEAVDTLVDTVAAHYPLAHRFYALKAKLLGLEKLTYASRILPIQSEESPSYTWDEALTFTTKVLSKLDPQYGEILQDFVNKGQVDVFPKKGKRGGAFCAYHLPESPVLMLLNFNGKEDDITTLAHETGHGINDVLIAKKQNALNLGTPLATAEVASTFMEDFVLEELAATATPKRQLDLLMSRLDDDIASCFRQIACYQFEQDLHATLRAEGNLSAEKIGELFAKHMQAYLGESVVMDASYNSWWVYWSHIRSHFYVYSYASGLLIAKALQSKVRKDPKAIEQVNAFLAVGRSQSPTQAFADLGIDITDAAFWEEGIAQIEQTLNTAEALATELKLI